MIIIKKVINVDAKTFKWTSIRNYYISVDGDVINITYKNDNISKIQFIQHDITSYSGHHRVPLKVEVGVEKKLMVHRLVYEVYTGEDISGYVIDHYDANPDNNNLNNLRKVKQIDNIQHALLNGGFGENGKKFVVIQDIETKEVLKFDKISDMNIFLGYSKDYEKGLKSTRTKKFKEKYILLETNGTGY